MKVNNPFKSNGFTLIEVLISLVILAISLLALAGLMTTTTRNTASGGNLTEAATFAQDKLEELRVTQWGNINGGADVRTGATGINYARTWTVATNAIVPPTPEPELRTVTITINWNDGINRSISLFSTILNPNPNDGV
ncbi:MAG: prepilin-type N-terminal cleavage/methylation domain-containing protein [Deltaproteobacteria bacterium]|nr:prepilin-type N-terminal cleavage/methylation domain-containing protein [Deltaproteobacteria bacterium]